MAQLILAMSVAEEEDAERKNWLCPKCTNGLVGYVACVWHVPYEQHKQSTAAGWGKSFA